MYIYYKLNLFAVLIVKFDQKSNFRPYWPKLGQIRVE